MKTYGYVRVSSKDQNPDRQVKAMKEKGLIDGHIYIEYISGKTFDRPIYKQMLKRMKAGDLLVVKSIDRLGRNYDEILEQWRYLTKEKGIDIEVIDMPLLNTTCGIGGLTGIFLSDIVLQILAYLAQSEREFIKQRQAEGIAIAKEKGVQFGARRKELPDNSGELLEAWKMKKISAKDTARLLGISSATFYRRVRESYIV